MPRLPHPLPPALGGEFSVAHARRLGVSAARLARSDLERPFHGARMIVAHRGQVDPDESPAARESRLLRAEIARRARAAASIAQPGWFFSHVTAAVLWELPLPLRVLRDAVGTDGGIDVAVCGESRAPRGRGIRGHQLRPELVSIRLLGEVAVCSPASVWAQLAPLLSIDQLVELADAIVYIPRRRGMVRGTSADALGTPEQLAAAMDAGRRHGVDRLRAALPQMRIGAASPAETRIRLAVIRAGLPEPELDVDVYAADGTAIGFTEFAYPDYRLLVEYEGDHHRVSRAQWNRDIEKHAACVDAGWSLVRLTSAHAYPDVAPAVRRIRAALERTGALI